MARRSVYESKSAEILRRLSKGEPLAQICRSKGMPAVRTVTDWKTDHPEFAEAYAKAREDGFDVIAADCLEIADNSERDTVYTENGARMDSEWVARSKLRVETRLKLLAKWDPKRYGERIELAGQINARVSAEPLTEEEWASGNP